MDIIDLMDVSRCSVDSLDLNIFQQTKCNSIANYVMLTILELAVSVLCVFPLVYLRSDGVVLEGCSEYSERCQSMLERMRKVCSQLEIDGVNNIWIIKPGAKSRGRGE